MTLHRLLRQSPALAEAVMAGRFWERAKALERDGHAERAATLRRYAELALGRAEKGGAPDAVCSPSTASGERNAD
jgi:hypothetical protein